MNQHVHATADLTKNQSLVLGALSKADGPLSAYTILDQLRENGLRAPLQVYRALDKLVEYGLVHRLESINAFVACSHPECENHSTMAFMICESCDKVSEITDDKLTTRLDAVAQSAHFARSKTTIELRGTCQSCRGA